jgi:hypothetical protein
LFEDAVAIFFYVVAGGTLLWALYSMFIRRRKEDTEERDPSAYPIYGPADGALSPNNTDNGGSDGSGDGGGGD